MPGVYRTGELVQSGSVHAGAHLRRRRGLPHAQNDAPDASQYLLAVQVAGDAQLIPQGCASIIYQQGEVQHLHVGR